MNNEMEQRDLMVGLYKGLNNLNKSTSIGLVVAWIQANKLLLEFHLELARQEEPKT